MNKEIIFKKKNHYISRDICKEDLVFCLHCQHVYPVEQLRIDFLGNRQGCGSAGKPDCDGAGVGIDIKIATSEFAIGCMKDWNINFMEAVQKGTENTDGR